MTGTEVVLKPIYGIPSITPGSDIPTILLDGLRLSGISLQDNDVLVVTQKVVSKAQNRFVRLADVRPTERAKLLANEVQKDPRLIEVILSESSEVVAKRPGLLITRHKNGEVMANAGVDMSNLELGEDEGPTVLCLPHDPDQTAKQYRDYLSEATGYSVAVVISDSSGRAWRNGVTNLALGVCGLPSLVNLVGEPDLYGRRLEVTEVAFADQIACAAGLLMGESSEGFPAVFIRGLRWTAEHRPGKALQRSIEEDLFAYQYQHFDSHDRTLS